MNKNWFTRFEQPELDDTYFHNMVDATAYFRKWFLEDSDVSYKDMLVKMHEIVASDGYQGHTNSNYILQVCHGFRGDNRTTWYPVLKKKWFDNVVDEPIIRPVVNCVPSWMSHHLVNTDEGYELHLSDGKYVRNYLYMLKAVMRNLRHVVTLKELAAYIQLFVIGHPFEKVNYSICMAQVNAILDWAGYRPTYHGWLDFECFVYDYDRIEKNFIKMVRGNKHEKIW